jgi:hypothetical protein
MISKHWDKGEHLPKYGLRARRPKRPPNQISSLLILHTYAQTFHFYGFANVQECRAVDPRGKITTYNFQGCWPIFLALINSNINAIAGIVIFVILLLVRVTDNKKLCFQNILYYCTYLGTLNMCVMTHTRWRKLLNFPRCRD